MLQASDSTAFVGAPQTTACGYVAQWPAEPKILARWPFMEKRLLTLGLKRITAGFWQVTGNRGPNLLMLQAENFSPVPPPHPRWALLWSVATSALVPAPQCGGQVGHLGSFLCSLLTNRTVTKAISSCQSVSCCPNTVYCEA